MVKFPLEHSRDLIYEFGGLDALASLVHGASVRPLERRIAIVIEQTATSVARLICSFTADYV